jgi:hypothetical protein
MPGSRKPGTGGAVLNEVAGASKTGKRLNPLFVEWLMGWPPGWTDFEPVAMEWSRWWQLMRSELSRLNS